MAQLRIEERTSGYSRGQRLHASILRTAFEILVDSGLDALTFGSIAKRMGTKSGNITYYFPTKESLIVELLNGIISNYEHDIDAIYNSDDLEDEDKFARITELIILDLPTKETTRIFPELWAKSNHDPLVQERLDDLYRRGRKAVVRIIARIRPDLSSEQHEMIGVICASCFEGMTIFAGHGKEWEARIDGLSRMTKSILLAGIRHLELD